MKKVLAICLMIVMAVSMSVSAFAVSDNFVVSPSVNPAPDLDDVTPSDDSCTAKVIITPYSERDNLPEEFKERIEKMYGEITSTDDLTKLIDELAKIVEELGIDGNDLSVSDLFNIHIEGCENHDKHGNLNVTISADTLDRFVSLVHLTADGKWETVDGAKVVNNGKNLQFNFNSAGSYAIVVNTGDVKDTPVDTSSTVTTKAPDKATQTGDASTIFTVVMVASAIAIVAVASKSKKERI